MTRLFLSLTDDANDGIFLLDNVGPKESQLSRGVFSRKIMVTSPRGIKGFSEGDVIDRAVESDVDGE